MMQIMGRERDSNLFQSLPLLHAYITVTPLVLSSTSMYFSPSTCIVVALYSRQVYHTQHGSHGERSAAEILMMHGMDWGWSAGWSMKSMCVCVDQVFAFFHFLSYFFLLLHTMTMNQTKQVIIGEMTGGITRFARMEKRRT